MATNQLTRLAQQQKRALAQATATTAGGITALYAGAKREIEPHVDQLVAAYGHELAQRRRGDPASADADPADPAAKVPFVWLHDGGRLQLLRHQVETHVGAASAAAESHVALAQLQTVHQATADFRAVMQRALAPTVGLAHVPPQLQPPRAAAIHALSGKLGNGRPLTVRFSQLAGELSDELEGALYAALALGMGPRELARELADLLDGPLSAALTIARTELVGAYRDAAIENYRANDDVVDQWAWLASPDACAACLAMSGTVHSLDEGMDSHPNCTCTPVPVTKSWADILGPLGIDASDLPDTTAEIPLGVDVFDGLSEEQQLAALGPAKYAAFLAGDLTLDDLVGWTSGRDGWPRSLYEKSLRELGLDAADYLAS